MLKNPLYLPSEINEKKTIFGFRKSKNGRVAERLGRGLQNLVRRFESAPDLRE